MFNTVLQKIDYFFKACDIITKEHNLTLVGMPLCSLCMSLVSKICFSEVVQPREVGVPLTFAMHL